MKDFFVRFKTREEAGIDQDSPILPFMEKLGVKGGEVYGVLGTIGDKILIRVGTNLLEVYPRHLQYVEKN